MAAARGARCLRFLGLSMPAAASVQGSGPESGRCPECHCRQVQQTMPATGGIHAVTDTPRSTGSIPPGTPSNSDELLQIPEVARLVNYAGEAAIQPDLVEDLHRLLLSYQLADKPKRLEIAPEIHRKYALLASTTKPVNGRTLLETERGSWFFWQISLLIIVLVATAIGTEILESWMANQPEPEDGWRLLLFAFKRHILEPVSPLIWGALGASVYLAKRIYDIAQLQYFDPAQLRGWWLRVILGAVLALVVLSIFNPEALASDQLPLAASAVAFLVGLGVKVVYGALESTVEALSNRLNLDALKRAPAETADLRTQLATEIKKATDAGDPQRAQVLSDMLNQLGNE